MEVNVAHYDEYENRISTLIIMSVPFNKAIYLSVAQKAASTQKCCCPKQSPPVLLFKGKGNDATTKNSWKHWYTEGGYDGGKTAAYDITGLHAVEIRDSEGTYVTYKLRAAYQGMSMLQIAKLKEDKLKDGNNGEAVWDNGLLTIGERIGSGIATGVVLGDGNEDFSDVLRLGVGDSTNDRRDWSFLFPLEGNCGTDFNSVNCLNIGGEQKLTNHEFGGNEYEGDMELWGYSM